MTTTGSIAPYLALITSEHQSAPNFLALVAAETQPFADIAAVAASMPGLFDLATAVGDQLDAVGEWIGLTRYLSVPIAGVYFSWDTAGVGWDQGVWQGPYDPSSGLVALPDAQYRTLLYARIARDHWNGTIPGAYAILEPVFPNNTVFIQDNGNMTMYIGLIGPTPDALTFALFTGGYLSVKPAGVWIAGYVTSSVPGTPVFGFDADNGTIGGWDHGSWATIAAGN